MNKGDRNQDLETLLVGAARRERPSPAVRSNVQAAIGLAAGLGGVAMGKAAIAATGSVVKTSLAALSASVIAKAVVVTVACSALVVGAAKVAQRSSPSGQAQPVFAQVASAASGYSSKVATVSTAPPADNSLPAVPAPEAAPASNIVPDQAAAQAPAAGSSHGTDLLRAKTSDAKAASLGDELASLDKARSSLQAGDASSALRTLDEYAKEFPKGKMTTEATVLRIDSLVRSGNLATARQLAASFEKAHPKSMLVPRVRALVSTSEQ